MHSLDLPVYTVRLKKGLCLLDILGTKADGWLLKEGFAVKEKTHSKLIEIKPNLYSCSPGRLLKENAHFIESRGLRILSAVEILYLQMYFLQNHNLKILENNSSMTSSFSDKGKRIAISSYQTTPIHIGTCEDVLNFGLGLVLCNK